MNIIEAIQAAEGGALITNNFMNNRFLKYIGNGVFYQYEFYTGKPEYKYEVREFSMAYILSIGWEVLDSEPFKPILEEDIN